MKKYLLIFFLKLSLIVLAGNAFGAIYYASPTGSGTTCSELSPCAIEYAVETKAQSGDTVKAQSGTYTTGQLSIPAGVTLTADVQTAPPNCTVTLRPSSNLNVGTPFISIVSGTPGAAGGQALSYIKLDGIGGTYYARQAIQVDNYSNVSITYCDVYGFTNVAASAWESSSWGVVARSTQLTESTASSNWNTYLQAPDQSKSGSYPTNPLSGLTFSYNRITNCGYSVTTEDNGHAMRLFHLYNSTISNNYIDHSHARSEAIETTPALWDNVTFQNNYIKTCVEGVHYDGTSPMWGLEVWVLYQCTLNNNKFVNAGMSTTFGKDNEWAYNIFDTTGTGSGNRTQLIEATMTNGALIHHNKFIGSGSAYEEVGLSVGSSNGNMPNGSTLYSYVWCNEFYNIKGLCAIRARSTDSSQTDYIYVIGNTVVGCNAPAIRTDTGTSTTQNLFLRNNLLQDNTYGVRYATQSGTLNTTTSNNLWWSNDTESDPASINTNDTNKVELIATFAEIPVNFTPASGSSNQVDVGTTTGTTVNGVVMTQKIHSTTDWGTGTSIPNVVLTDPSGTPDIGAGESGGSVTDEAGPTISAKSPQDGHQYSSDTTSFPLSIFASDPSGMTGCKWDDTNVAYASMAHTMSEAAGTYTDTKTGGVSNTQYTVYGICRDAAASPNDTPFTWTFSTAPESGGSLIVDNSDTGYSEPVGTWVTSTALPSQIYGTNYRHNNADSDTDTAKFTPTVSVSGNYTVYLWWTAYTNRSTSVKVQITHASGTDTVYVNQTQNGGQWNALGTYYFNSGTGGYIVVGGIGSSGDTAYVVADAARLEPFQPTGNSISIHGCSMR